LHFGTWSFYFFIFGLYNFKFVHFNHWIFIKSNLGVWWWNPTLKSNLYDINIIPFKIYFQFYVSGYKLRELSLPFLFNQKKNIFQCSELGLVILLLTHQAAKIEISNLFFFLCALSYNSIPALVCGLRNTVAIIIIIIIITIISCLASS
jgi:hypothetical protein